MNFNELYTDVTDVIFSFLPRNDKKLITKRHYRQEVIHVLNNGRVQYCAAIADGKGIFAAVLADIVAPREGTPYHGKIRKIMKESHVYGDDADTFIRLIKWIMPMEINYLPPDFMSHPEAKYVTKLMMGSSRISSVDIGYILTKTIGNGGDIWCEKMINEACKKYPDIVNYDISFVPYNSPYTSYDYAILADFVPNKYWDNVRVPKNMISSVISHIRSPRGMRRMTSIV